MIYGRWGGQVEPLRYGNIEDVKRLDNRKPDQIDRQNVENRCYVVCREVDTGRETLQGLAYMRADGGLTEILDALREKGEDV